MSIPNYWSPLPTPGNLPLLSRPEQAYEAVLAGMQAGGYEAIGDTVFYGSSVASVGAGVLGLVSVPFSDLSSRSREQLRDRLNPSTPDRPVTPPPRITPSKRPRGDEGENFKMPGMSTQRYGRGRAYGTKYGSRRYKTRVRTAMTARRYRRLALYPAPARIIRNPIAETKYLESNVAGTFSAAAWAYVSFMAINQGTSANTRLGNKIYVSSIEVMGFMTCTGGSGGQFGNLCRTVLYENKQANGALPSATPSIFATDTVNALRYTPLFQRFRCLRDSTHAIPVFETTGGGTPVAQASVPMRLHWKVPIGKVVDYSSNAGTISDLAQEDYGLALIAKVGATCTFDFRVKVLFKDL